MKDVKGKMVKGTFWTLLEKLSLQFVAFVVSMILSRILTPTDYGTVALLGVFMSISGVLVDSGFGSALVQKKDATELDFNSVFYLSIGVSFAFYAVLFLCAPAISRFYDTPELVWILRIVALQLVFHAINSVQGAELSRKMLFHLSFRISLISTIPSAIVGIPCAIWGYGPWALVFQGLTAGILGVVARWFIIAWRPRLMFSFKAVMSLYSFGWKLAADRLLDSAFSNVWGLVIGKFYSKADLAYVGKGKHLPSLLMDSINGTLGRVTFPVLVQYQDDKCKIREATRRIVQCSSFLIFPAMMGCAACAHNMIILLFGKQWSMAVPYAQFACFQFALWPLALVQQTLLAIGRSDVLLKIDIVRKIFGFSIMGATLWISPLAFMAAMAFIYAPVCTWTNTWPNKKLFGYSFLDEVRDVASIAAATGIMMIAMWGVDLVAVPCGFGGDAIPFLIFRLIIQVVLGLTLYFLLAIWFHIPALDEYLLLFLPKIATRFPRIARVGYQIHLRLSHQSPPKQENVQ